MTPDDQSPKSRGVPLGVDELARMLSHDLRTPLSIMLLQAEIINRKPTTERNAQRAQTILTAGRQLSAMVQDVVDVLRLEAGVGRLDPQPLDLDTFLRDLPRSLITARDAPRLEIQVEPGLPPVRVDHVRLERALAHLVANARHHAPADSVVSLAARRRDGVVELAVSDTGAGIAAEHLPRLFDPSYRNAEIRSGHGLGLGLYLCDLTARVHGGRLQVSTAPGEGSTFTMLLRPAG